MRISLQSSFDYRRPEPRKTLARGEKNARILAVCSQKGGVGKTTTSVSLAAAWARYCGQRVLLVDVDPLNSVGDALGNQIEVGGGALNEVLQDPQTHDVEDIVTSTRIPNLFVTPPDAALHRIEDRLASKIGKELLLKKALEVTRTHYDLIVLDCPPNSGTLMVNALCAADCVVVPCHASALSIPAASHMLYIIEDVRTELNPALEVLGIVLTAVDGRNSRNTAGVMEMLGDGGRKLLLPTQIGISTGLQRAQLLGRDVFDVEPECRGAKQYRELAEDLLGRMGRSPS